jgi:hypothetical protein
MSQPGQQNEEWRKAAVPHVTLLVPLQVTISQDMKADIYCFGFLQTLSFHICIVEEMAVNVKGFRSNVLIFYAKIIMFQNFSFST